MTNFTTQNTAEDIRYDETSSELDIKRLNGFSASEGIANGHCIVVKDYKALHNLKEGAIIVCESATPDFIPYMPFIKGLATEKGGTMTTAAWHARRNGIPTVTGVAGIMDSVKDGDIICIYGSKGVVEIIK
ncbi:MAG TPA: PEP-utilizing enzyme [Syntrophorhabdaceae bacterium]|nr:PEP-utilizing enzyme [Syntrophorhabdaceae bacterium]